MWSRNMELTELLLTNTDVIGGKRAPNPRTPRHYDNGGKMPCNLEAETIANSAGETAQVSIVAQPSIRFLNTKYYSNGSPTEDTEDCHHCRTYPVQIINPACLPARHDGANGHGTGDCDHCIWHPGPPKRDQVESRNGASSRFFLTQNENPNGL